MTVTVQELADYVRAPATEPALPGLLAVAVEKVADYLGTNGLEACPPHTLELATLTLASELWARRNSGGGGVVSIGPDGQPVRLGRDPMAAVRPLIRKYKGLGVVG